MKWQHSCYDGPTTSTTGGRSIDPRKETSHPYWEGLGTMIRAAYFAFALICFSSGYARADNFTFSFTDNVTGTPNVDGTVTGEIFGLTNDWVSRAATSIVITSYPAGLN